MLNLSSVDLVDERVMMRYELLGAGYSGRTITRLRREGVFHRLRHGAYASGELWKELGPVERRQLVARAALRSARAPAALAGPDAADQLGAPVWDMGADVHLLRLDEKAGRRQAGIAQHRGRTLVGDLTIRDGFPCTSGTRTAADMIALAEPEHALVTINGLVRAGETSIDLIVERVAAMSHDPRTLSAPIVLALVEPLCESAGETRSFMLFRRQQLPRPVPQYEVRDGRGRVVARVDFAWPELGVFVEFDGVEKYHRHRRPGESIEQMVLREKRREELICGLTGWRCIRITWVDLSYPRRTADRIRSAIAGRPWAA